MTATIPKVAGVSKSSRTARTGTAHVNCVEKEQKHTSTTRWWKTAKNFEHDMSCPGKGGTIQLVNVRGARVSHTVAASSVLNLPFYGAWYVVLAFAVPLKDPGWSTACMMRRC